MLVVVALKRVESFLWSAKSRSFRTRILGCIPAKQRIPVKIIGLSFTPYRSILDSLHPFRKFREKS